MREIDHLTAAVIEQAIRIHREPGPGLLESVYELVLAAGLARRGFVVERHFP